MKKPLIVAGDFNVAPGWRDSAKHTSNQAHGYCQVCNCCCPQWQCVSGAATPAAHMLSLTWLTRLMLTGASCRRSTQVSTSAC